MEAKALTVLPREGAGKGLARKLRSDGMIPAVIYGSDISPQTVSVRRRELLGVLRASQSGNIIIDLKVSGDDSRTYKVLVKDIQKDPVEGDLLHVDFQQISLTKEIHVNIPLRLTGVAYGVKTMGGILEFVQREVAVACLPTDIKDFIEIDITDLKIGDSVHAGDLVLDKLELLTNPNQVLVMIAAPTISKIAEAAEAVEGEEGAVEGAEAAEEGGEQKEPEVISEKRKGE